MNAEAMRAFWESLSAAPNVFVSLLGEEFHARPLKTCLEEETRQIWIVVPENTAMARRLHLNGNAFMVVNSRDGTFSGKVVGLLQLVDDDVSRRRLLRGGGLRSWDLEGALLVKFVPKSGEAWVGASLHQTKLGFEERSTEPLRNAVVVHLNAAQ